MQTVIVDPKQPENEPQPIKDPSFWGICLGHTFTHWYPATFYILLPFITLELGFSITQAGLLVTMMYLVKSFTSMPIGAITDMTGKKNIMMIISISLAGLPFIFMGLIESYWVLMFLIIVMGIGNEMWHPASFSTLSARYPRQRGFTFGLHGMAANLGDVLAPATIGLLMVTMTWREVVFWNVLPGIIIALAILLLFSKGTIPDRSDKQQLTKDQQTQHSSKTSFADYRNGLVELFKNRSILLLSLASGIRSMSQNGLMTFLPIYLALELSLSPLLVGLYVTVLQGGGLLAAPIVGGISDKFGRRRILSSGMVMTSIMILVVVMVQIDWLLIVTMGLLGFFLYSLRPVMQAWAMENASKKMAGTTTSLLFTTQAFMASSSPLIGGILADQFGITAAFYFIAGVILAGNIVVALIPKGQ
jgi:FSR family fosmidomycin resistance protein-like MFS transporter